MGVPAPAHPLAAARGEPGKFAAPQASVFGTDRNDCEWNRFTITNVIDSNNLGRDVENRCALFDVMPYARFPIHATNDAMTALVKSLAGIGFGLWLGGCTVGSFDLSRMSTSSPSQNPPPAVEPATAPPGGASAAPHQAPATEPPSQTYQPPVYQPPPRQTSRPLPAARAERTPDTPPPAPAQPEPDVLTMQSAREQCWMASENTKFKNNLDLKVKFVEKCVADKMRSAGQ